MRQRAEEKWFGEDTKRHNTNEMKPSPAKEIEKICSNEGKVFVVKMSDNAGSESELY